MNIRIVTASAGSGKTHRLTQELDTAISNGTARPDSIVATTFTTQAAAELVERARSRLLQSGHGQAAHQLLAARIGTVNAVCGALVADFAFELGMSPALRVLDEVATELEFRRALARVVSTDLADELERFKNVFERDFDWRVEVRRIVEAARANGLDPARLAACAERSILELDACLGPFSPPDSIDAALFAAIANALTLVDVTVDTTKVTREYLELVRNCERALRKGRLCWGDWAKLAKNAPGAKSKRHTLAIQEAASRHLEHPRLRAEMHAFIRRLFQVASDGLAAYQTYKREQGVVDFIDQETLALELLRRPDVRAALAGQIDLFLVDEFQDTSPIQLAVFLEIAQLATTSIWVGDPKQAIYAFRGTDPALMDAAIESLTSPTTDGELVAQATDALSHGRVETLGISYRSRPALVAVTSEVFARAFAHQGMPEDRTRLEPALKVEPADLGEVIEYWPLDLDRSAGTANAQGRADSVAAGVGHLLERHVSVRDGSGTRPVGRGDLAVLCRTNAQCQAVAEALGSLGIAAVVPRMSLLDTLEARVAVAGLALWVDPDDALAAAELARMITHPTALDPFVAQVLAAPGRDAFRDDRTVVRIATSRSRQRDLGPVAALDAVLAATELRALCAGWGDAAQRLANLDALRAHAVAYVGQAASNSNAATIVGFLGHLDGLVSDGRWGSARTDRQALRGGDDAVTVSTWHRAKGLEWPIVVLFGLETVREPTAHGTHVISDRVTFDAADPLGGRWIRYWPNVYTTTNQLGAVRDAYEASPVHAALVARAAGEALRVLYVGWTRARDRIVFAAERGKLLNGIVGTLSNLDSALIDEPRVESRGIETARWGGLDVVVRGAPCSPAEPVLTAPVPGSVTVGRTPQPRFPARTSPSTAAAVPSSLGEIVELGPRIPISGPVDMEYVGRAVHGFLAADRPGLSDVDRIELAEQLLKGFEAHASVAAAHVVDAASRLWAWIDQRFPTARLHREWPVGHRTFEGTVVAGTADLVIEHGGKFVVIDHKTFPGGIEAAKDRTLGYSGQLQAYARAMHATGAEVASHWIHFPVLGYLAEVTVQPGE